MNHLNLYNSGLQQRLQKLELIVSNLNWQDDAHRFNLDLDRLLEKEIEMHSNMFKMHESDMVIDSLMDTSFLNSPLQNITTTSQDAPIITTTIPSHSIVPVLNAQDMDIEITPLLESQSNASLLSPQNDSRISEIHLNISTKHQNETLGSDWSIEMFQDDPPLLNSENDINSFPLMPKSMNGQSNAENQLPLAPLGDPGTSRISSTLSELSNASSDEIIIRRDRSTAMIIDDSEDEQMDVTYTTLVNPSPTASIIWINDENSILEQNTPVNGVILSALGLKNKANLERTGQYPNDIYPKDCNRCGEEMDWRTTGTLRSQYRNRAIYRYTYHSYHNGNCLKESVSIPVKRLVENYERCHNPRCSGVNPTFFWEKNLSLYCTEECCDVYQEWQNENAAKHRQIMEEADAMGDAVAAEAHRMTSNQYRNMKEVAELRRTVPAKYKDFIALIMRNSDMEFKKKKSSTSAIWRDFVIPSMEHYQKIMQQMDLDYDGKCPCCLKPELIFLSDSGIWQASKDRMKNGLPYGHQDQVVRWCCTCCNNALQQMPDRTLQQWFKDVALAAPKPPVVTSHKLTTEEKLYIKALHNVILNTNDKKLKDESVSKGYEVIGDTASLDYFYSLASQNLYCSTTGVLVSFDKSDPSLEPFTVSFNRTIGSVGPSRCKPTKKHLQDEGNLEVVCRALNLAQRNFTSALIQGWLDWIVECWTIAEVFSQENPEFEVEDETQDSDEDIE